MTGVYDESDIDFLVHLGTRTSAAIEKTRIYQRGQAYILQMDRLHEVNVTISSSLDMDDLRHMSVRGVTVLQQGTSAFICDYTPRTETFTVQATHIEEDVSDRLPAIGHTFRLKDYPTLERRCFQGVFQFQMSDADQPDDVKMIGQLAGYQSGLIIPLVQEDKILGLIVMGESRYERYFTTDDLALVRNFGVHVTVMSQQARLFAEVKDLEQIKSEMIRMASHDLKNPLLQVTGYLDLLERTMHDQLDQRQTEFFERIQSGADKMNNLIEDILNLEKVESQRPTSWKPLDARLLLLEVINSLEPQVEIKNLQLHIDVLTESVPVHGSDAQLKQAFANLIGNAIKYTPAEGNVTIRAYIEAGEFQFEVEDTGYGVPVERQARLFERFYRAQTPGTEQISGTGLGLSLVKTVVRKHGGDVWFESVEGGGSTFGFWLPLQADTANE
jgi:signal transduction histidine kinase